MAFADPTDRLDPFAESGGVLVVDVSPSADSAVCVCGHVQDAHEHYRPGSDCALCDCPRFRRAR